MFQFLMIALLTFALPSKSPRVGDFIQFKNKIVDGHLVSNPNQMKSHAIWRIDRIEKTKGIKMTLIEGKTFFSTRGLLGPGIGNLFFSSREFRKKLDPVASGLNPDRIEQVLLELEIVSDSKLIQQLKEISRVYPDVEHY